MVDRNILNVLDVCVRSFDAPQRGTGRPGSDLSLSGNLAHIFSFYCLLSYHLGFTFFCLKLPSAAAAVTAATVSLCEIGHSLIGNASC